MSVRKVKPRKTTSTRVIKPVTRHIIKPLPVSILTRWIREEMETPRSPECVWTLAQAVTCAPLGRDRRLTAHPASAKQFRALVEFENRYGVLDGRKTILGQLSPVWHDLLRDWGKLATLDDSTLDEALQTLIRNARPVTIRPEYQPARKTKPLSAPRPMPKDDDVFTIIGMGAQEIKHSNFLSYMLDPHRNHGCGDRMMGYLSAELGIVNQFGRRCGWDDLTVTREVKGDIDLLLESEVNKTCVVIENKVNAALSPGQLDKYAAYVKSLHPDWQRIHLYLTPTGRKPERSKCVHPDEWIPIAWSQISDVLWRTIAKDKQGAVDFQKATPMARFLVASYLRLLDSQGIAELPAGRAKQVRHILSSVDANGQAETVARLTAENARLKNLNKSLMEQTVKDRNHLTDDGLIWRHRALEAEAKLRAIRTVMSQDE